MSDKYDDIKQLTRPQYDDLPPMSRHDRAAQFSPFAALVGYGDAIDETARLTDSKKELTEDEMTALNDNLRLLTEASGKQTEVRVTYFVPDKRKSGGSYKVKTGAVRFVDTYENMLVFADGSKIPIGDLYSITVSGND